jgi:hypothetical protein
MDTDRQRMYRKGADENGEHGFRAGKQHVRGQARGNRSGNVEGTSDMVVMNKMAHNIDDMDLSELFAARPPRDARSRGPAKCQTAAGQLGD